MGFLDDFWNSIDPLGKTYTIVLAFVLPYLVWLKSKWGQKWLASDESLPSDNL